MSADDLNVTVLAVSAALLAGVVAVRIASRSGLPGLLLYLGIGLAIGESGLGLGFEDVDLAMVLGSLALAVILAEGGFTTQWDVTRPVAAMSAVLATVGVGLSVAITAGLTYVILDVDVRTALLLGAVVSSTDAAAVFSVLRQMPVNRRLRATLEAESGFNDPPVIILVTVITSDAWNSSGPLEIGALMLQQLVVGAVIGIAVAWAGQWVLRRSALPSAGLYPLATVAILFLAFASAGIAGGSPFLAVYLAGLWLGNTTLPHRGTTAGFTEGLAWIAQIGLFIMLGLLASPARLTDALVPALVVGGVLLLVARPISILACATPYQVPWREQVFMSWAGLRGAVPIVLATIPITQGLPSAYEIFDVVFVLVVVFTIVQGPTLPWAARRLGVEDDAATTDVTIESAPLEEIDASLLRLAVPEGSRLAGVYLPDLRLPGDAAIALVVRRGEIFVPDQHTVLRTGDVLLIATPDRQRDAVQERLAAVNRDGRLAGWRSNGPATPAPGAPLSARQRAQPARQRAKPARQRAQPTRQRSGGT